MSFMQSLTLPSPVLRLSLFMSMMILLSINVNSCQALISKCNNDGSSAITKVIGSHCCGRTEFVQKMLTAATTTTTGIVAANAISLPVFASSSDDSSSLGLSDQELKEIVKSDIIDKQFLATGQITRRIYRPTATFTDEIDTYKLDQWVKGTQRLFVGEKSKVRLVGDVNVDKDKIDFRFDEDLMFNIPFRPTVSLTGKVVLERDAEGYITSYKEFWDQDVLSVLKTAKF